MPDRETQGFAARYIEAEAWVGTTHHDKLLPNAGAIPLEALTMISVGVVGWPTGRPD